MTTGATFQLISNSVHCHLCYGREYKHDYKPYNKEYPINYDQYKCCCEVPDRHHKDRKAYLYAIERCCLICMSKYLGLQRCLHAETHCTTYYTYIDILKHAILTEAVKIGQNTAERGQNTAERGQNTGNRGQSHAYDMLIHSVQNLHYMLNDIYIYFPKPLSMDQIRMLLNYYWLPTCKFLQPYKHPSHIKKIIELKSILLKCDWDHMIYRHKVNKAIRTIEWVIRDYNTVKTNLYILCRGNRLCNDTASIVEAFLMKDYLSLDHNMDKRVYFQYRDKYDTLKRLVGIYD